MMARRRLRSVNKAFTIKRLLLITLALGLIAAGVFGVKAYLSSRSSFGTQTALPFYSEAVYACSNGVFYYVEGGKLHCYDPKNPDGATEMDLGTSDVSIAAGGGTAALYSGTSVQIIGASDFIDVGGQVLSLRCAANHIAVLRLDPSGAAAVLVYDKTGTLVDVIEQKDDILLDCGFYSSDGGDLMWTLSLSSSAATPLTTLTTYSYLKQSNESVATMSGVITVQNQLVDRVVFTKNSIFISGTEQLMRCDAGISGESWRLLTYGYKMTDSSTSAARPVFLFVPRGEEGETMNMVKLYSADEAAQPAASARTVQLKEGVHSIMLCSGKLAAFSDTKLYIYSAAGKLSATYELDFSCSGAKKLSENEVICESSDGALRLIKLK